MASLDTLSDAEIRSKLVDLGCDIGPVTPSTRRVYVKKLQSLLENGDSGTKIKKSDSPPQSPEDTLKSRRKSPVRSKTTRKPTASSSDVHPLASSTLVDTAHPNFVKSSILTEGRPTIRTTQDVTPDKRTSSSTNFTSPTEIDDPSTFRSTFNFNSPSGYNGIAGSKYNSPQYVNSRFESDQPYASEFTRRLSNSSASRIAAQTASPRSPLFNSKNYDCVKESDDEEDSAGPVYNKFGTSSRGSMYQRGNNQAYPQQGGWFGKDASVFILGFLALFFVIVAYIYIHIHHSDSTVAPYVSDLFYPRCNGITEHCIPDHEVEKATKVFKLLCSELSDIASKGGCSDNDSPKISLDEASRVVNMKDGSLSVFELDTYIYYAGILANSNANQNVKFTQQDGFKLREVPSSLFCTLVNSTMSLTVWFIRIVVFLVVLLSIYLVFKHWMIQKSKHQEEVSKLFTQIIDLVSSTSIQEGPRFAVKSHILDRLIPAQDKFNKMKVWEEASGLVDSDSRVRTEVQQVEGEDFLVWRWLAPPPNPKKKVWQGQAFETMDGSVNSLPESPTSCLKIRHMFDPSQEEGEGWVQAVADAILEKCKDASIYHIVVEKQSPEGCVYVKCASPRDAGIAYKALHGFWFDTKLVTVKYIREARYLERFPDSIRAKYPLVPSSKRQH